MANPQDLKPLRRLAGGRTLAATPREDRFFLLEDATGEAMAIPLARAIALLSWPEAVPDPPAPAKERRRRPTPRLPQRRRGSRAVVSPDRRTLREAVRWILTLDPHQPEDARVAPEDLDAEVEARVNEIQRHLADPTTSRSQRALARTFYGDLARLYRLHEAGR